MSANIKNSAKNVNPVVSSKLAESQNSAKIASMSKSEKDALLQRLLKLESEGNLKGIQENFVMYRFQMLSPKLGDKEQKSKRNQFRTKLFNFSDSISLYYVMSVRAKKEDDKKNHLSKMNAQIIEFIAFYKSTYINNDYSLASLFSGSDDKKKRVQDLLSIIQDEYLSKQIKKEVAPKKVQPKKEVKEIIVPKEGEIKK